MVTLNKSISCYRRRSICCDIHNNNHIDILSNSNENNYKYKHLLTKTIRVTFGIWSFLTLAANAIKTVQTAAVYSNVNFLANPNFEPICNAQQEHFIESDGKESSLILEFNSGVLAEKKKSCTRILSAPANYGFIVRLILPKIRHNHHNGGGQHRGAAIVGGAVALSPTATTTMTAEQKAKISTASASRLNDMTSLIEKLNTTALKTVMGRTCPLSIFSSLDPHTPQWRIDPCQLEDTAPEMEDPVRLFHGRVRIVWEHGHNTLSSKLMVTVLGKGDQCRSENKHQCLKIGDEPILCISQELVCDGIRHCPYSIEYDSDEDYTMCWKRRRFDEPMPPAMESDIFEHFALEVFRNLFAFDVTTSPAPTVDDDGKAMPVNVDATTAVMSSSKDVNRTMLRKVDANVTGSSSNSDDDIKPMPNAENSTENTSGGIGHHRRNSTRMGLNSDLSKYGPWGYLMLGMLLCGGALLICGLWASASQHAANNERESALQSAAGAGNEHQSGSTSPPNYEELDPPPAYSVLFPNQKAASSTTLSSLGAPSPLMASTVEPVLAVAAASLSLSPTTTTASSESILTTTPATIREITTSPASSATIETASSSQQRPH